MCGVPGSQPLEKTKPPLSSPRHPLAHPVRFFVTEASQRSIFGGTRYPSIREARAPPRLPLAHPFGSGMLEASQICFWGTKHSILRGQLQPSSDTHHPASIQPFSLSQVLPCTTAQEGRVVNTHTSPEPIHPEGGGQAWISLPSGNFFSFLKATS